MILVVSSSNTSREQQIHYRNKNEVKTARKEGRMHRISRTLMMLTSSLLLLVSFAYADAVTPGMTID